MSTFRESLKKLLTTAKANAWSEDDTKTAALGLAFLEKAIKTPTIFKIEHDGFEGEIIGTYTTRENKEGVVLQQVGTRVVHVYGRKWLK